jgi:hypothetical protein
MFKNEDGSVGILVYFFILLLAFGFLYLILGPVVDQFVDQGNDQTTNPSLVVSQGRMDLLNNLVRFWWALPLIVLFAAGYFAIKGALRERSGEVG